ncbi:MAG: hypothetical protein EBW20_09770, partial [Betaproteobacteria bacterium]|nr:hypothetical protein [Betaproteobacteria bacterium]
MPRSNHDAIKPRQEALALQVCDAPQLLHFVAGPNQELLHRLQRIESERSGFVALHLWGAEGAGKSFLCQCFGPLATQDDRYVIHDDIDVLQPKDHQTQAKLLQAFNRLREADDGVWLSTSRLPPTQLDLMADLRSRLSWGLVYELKLLADEDKLAALEAWAQENWPKLSSAERLQDALIEIRPLGHERVPVLKALSPFDS